jgi:hypothetical protein
VTTEEDHWVVYAFIPKSLNISKIHALEKTKANELVDVFPIVET